MQIKIDVKSLVAGLILGAVVFLVMGQVYNGAGVSDFGFTVDRSSFAIIRDKANVVYVVDPQKEKATIIEYGNGPYKGRFMDLDMNIKVQEKK